MAPLDPPFGSFTRALAVAILIRSLAAPPLQSQALGLDPDRDFPAWLRAWSALGDRGNLPRRLPGAGTATSAFQYGAPRVGLFWTGGNPAGLPAAVSDSRTDFAGTWSRQAGDYRRPLDPVASRLVQVMGQSWRPFTATFAMIGRVVLDQERFDPGTRSDRLESFPSSPFVSSDTSAAALRRNRVVLEGGAGWRIGEWAVGGTLGFEGRQHTTIVSPLSRQSRVATPGIVLGLSRRLGGLELGPYGRIRRQVETVQLNAVAAEGQVYELAGYREAPGLGMSINGDYFRRREETAPAAGLGLAGRLASADWTVVVERTSVRERLWIQRRNDPPQDRWNAVTWSGGLAAQRPFGRRVLVTLHARAVYLTGDAELAADSGAIFFMADERSWQGEAELRLQPGDRSGWSGAFTLALGSERRERSDTIPGLRAKVTGSSFTCALEMGRFLGSRIFVSVGGVVSWYGPTSTLPNPTSHGAVYRTNFASELDLYGKAARPTAFVALVRWGAPGGIQVWMTARTERLTPASGERLTAFTPTGNRVASSIVAGVTLDNP